MKTVLSSFTVILGRNRSGLKNFSIYFGSNFAAKLVPFFLLPIITRYITPEEYGVWALFWMFVTLITPVLAVGGLHHINRNFHQLEKPVLANQIFNLMCQSAVLFCIFMLVAFGIGRMPGNFFSIPDTHLYLVPVVAFLMALMNFTTSLLLYEKRAWFFAYIETAYPLLSRVLAIGGMIWLGMRWEALSWGTLISAVFVSMSCMIYLRKNHWLKPPFNLKISLTMLAINAPLIPHLLLAPLHGMVDRMMLETLTTTEAVGIYSIGYTFGITIMLIVGAYSKVWQPWVYKLLADPTRENKISIVKSSYLYFGVIIVSAVAISLGSAVYIHLFFVEDYHPATSVIFWVAITGLPQVLTQSGLVYLNQQEKTLFFPILSFLAVILNFVLNAFMIPAFGMIGAAQATLISNVILAIIVFSLAQRHMPMPWLFFIGSNRD